MTGAAFSSSVGDFGNASVEVVIGRLTEAIATQGYALQHSEQVRVWRKQLELLRTVFADLMNVLPSSRYWHVLLEFPIPRRNKRPDVVLLAGDVIFVVEFKFGATAFSNADKWQAEDYALDLRDFHTGSAGRRIIPVLVATDAPNTLADLTPSALQDDLVYPVQCVSSHDLCQRLVQGFAVGHRDDSPAIAPSAWEHSSYRPTLNIIEAAERLYANHGVREISHAHAGNLTLTSRSLVEAIASARSRQERVICFVTGVPGAGKTLAGLNAVHDPILRQTSGNAGVFLSGNGPLVKIVRAAPSQTPRRGE